MVQCKLTLRLALTVWSSGSCRQNSAGVPLSCCEFWNYRHPVNLKFTTWHHTEKFRPNTCPRPKCIMIMSTMSSVSKGGWSIQTLQVTLQKNPHRSMDLEETFNKINTSIIMIIYITCAAVIGNILYSENFQSALIHSQRILITAGYLIFKVAYFSSLRNKIFMVK